MADFDWKSLVGTVAPTLATALGGPMAGMAVSAISKAVLGNPDAGEQDVKDAILKSNNPETLLKLKQAEIEFAQTMKKLDIDLEKLAADDRNSARQREVSLKDNTTKYLAFAYTLGYFAILGFVMIRGIPTDQGSTREVLNVLLGVMSAAQMSIITYYFGSSAGSARKSATMEDLLKK